MAFQRKMQYIIANYNEISVTQLPNLSKQRNQAQMTFCTV